MRTGRRASTPSADDERGVAVPMRAAMRDDTGRELKPLPLPVPSDAKTGRSSVSGVPTRDALLGDGDRRADSAACIVMRSTSVIASVQLEMTLEFKLVAAEAKNGPLLHCSEAAGAARRHGNCTPFVSLFSLHRPPHCAPGVLLLLAGALFLSESWRSPLRSSTPFRPARCLRRA